VNLSERVREALGGERRPARFQPRHVPELPAVNPRAASPLNVLLILQEAVRADMACPLPGAHCDGPTAPSHKQTPERIQLQELRANSSSTAIALATTFSGLAPTAPRGRLFAAPLLWDFANAAGYRTAYVTSQHPMFANTRLLVQGAPKDACVWATHLDPMADFLVGANDEAVSERALEELDVLGEPFFSVVHYSNVHMPRRIDPTRAPFVPTDDHFERKDDEAQRNYYKNAVYSSDLAVAQLIAGVRGRAFGSRTVIVYLSDHGESYLEHGQTNDHGSTLFDEEIRIPGWIDAPDGTLTPDQREHLQQARERPLFQTSIAPTVLDLLGIWDAPELRTFVARMAATPLTQALPSTRSATEAAQPEILTNVSWAWEYGDPNWAVMVNHRKLLALSNDDTYQCFDVAADPQEQNNLGAQACAALLLFANNVFGDLPQNLHRLRDHPSWGFPPSPDTTR
jgi:hypothetical protein